MSLELEATLAGLTKLGQARLKSRANGPEFVIALIRAFGVSVSSTGALELRVNLSLQLPVLQTFKDRYRLRLACEKHDEAWDFIRNLHPGQSYQYLGPVPFRWSSGGCFSTLWIDGREYVVMLYRDRPSFYPIVGWNLPLGCSKSRGDLVRLNLLAQREFQQEILVVNTKGGFCYRLEFPGGTASTLAYYRQLVRLLNLRVAVEREPLIATCATGPDQAIVTTDWEKQSWPHVTETGFFVFTPRNGEMGIEYIQIPTWHISASLHDLRIYDGRIRRGLNGQPTRLTGQPVAVFPIDELSKPCPRPAAVFESGGWVYTGDDLKRWLEQHKYSNCFTPATREILRRFLKEVRKVGDNGFHKQVKHWSIRFEGATVVQPDSVGIRHIHQLVQNAGQEVPCQQLQERNGRRACAVLETDSDAINPVAEGLFVSSGLGTQPINDPKAERDYVNELKRLKLELRELKEAYDEAERLDQPAEAARLDAQMEEKKRDIDRVVKELLRRRQTNWFPDPWRRNPIKAVHRAINRALRAISACHAALGEHLSNSLKLGSQCVYKPSAPCPWDFTSD